ncbi:MAG: DNRLRE domain-containing protein [Caldilineaceae bacterium]
MHPRIASTYGRLRPICYVLPLLLCLIIVAPIAAQSIPPAPNERALDRTAPTREPVTLRTELRADAVNTVLQLPAIADTYIASERPDENFGSDALFLGYNFFGDRFGAQRLLLRFNVDSIPDNARINSAHIRLRLSFASPADDGPMRTILRRLASDWGELGVTWNGEPDWAAVRDSTFVGTTPQWYEWEVPDLVQGWVDGTFPNHGVELIGDERVQQRERIFYARETNTDYFPQLVVDYDVVTDQAPPVVTVEALPDYSGRSFAVRWSGEDVGDAGIAYYDVQYRVDGGDWVDWQFGVTDTVEEFMNGQNGHTYEFRARGVDQAGNVELFGDPEAETVVDTAPPASTVAVACRDRW